MTSPQEEEGNTNLTKLLLHDGGTANVVGSTSTSLGVRYYNTGNGVADGTLEYTHYQSQTESTPRPPGTQLSNTYTKRFPNPLTRSNPAYNIAPRERLGAISSRPLPKKPTVNLYTRYEGSGLYDEIPALDYIEAVPRARQGKVLCRVWHGKLEIGIRVAILLVSTYMHS